MKINIFLEGYFMKTCKRILAVLLMLSCVFLFASCGTFGGIKKNFEDAGTVERCVADDEDGSRTANTIVAEMEEGDISCTLHIFKKDNTTLGITTYQYAYILEFKSDAQSSAAYLRKSAALRCRDSSKDLLKMHKIRIMLTATVF